MFHRSILKEKTHQQYPRIIKGRITSFPLAVERMEWSEPVSVVSAFVIVGVELSIFPLFMVRSYIGPLESSVAVIETASVRETHGTCDSKIWTLMRGATFSPGSWMLKPMLPYVMPAWSWGRSRRVISMRASLHEPASGG